ncbi:unnamed protein product [Dovyalis caffra]|uniref:Ribosomal protein L32 n=1 Tax=Dovyalis caffra TaxID=77055 RepID=A0AAV1SIY7_9ROSI|nr:unnamed protein product [Dovyalis caffra]
MRQLYKAPKRANALQLIPRKAKNLTEPKRATSSGGWGGITSVDTQWFGDQKNICK